MCLRQDLHNENRRPDLVGTAVFELHQEIVKLLYATGEPLK